MSTMSLGFISVISEGVNIIKNVGSSVENIFTSGGKAELWDIETANLGLFEDCKVRISK